MFAIPGVSADTALDQYYLAELFTLFIVNLDVNDFLLILLGGAQEKVCPSGLQRQQMPRDLEGLGEHLSLLSDKARHCKFKIAQFHRLSGSLNDDCGTSESEITLTLPLSSSLRQLTMSLSRKVSMLAGPMINSMLLYITDAFSYALLPNHVYLKLDLNILDMEKITDLISKNREEIVVFGVATLIVQLLMRTRKQSQKVVDEHQQKYQELQDQLLNIRSQKFKELKRRGSILIPHEIIEARNSLVDEITFLCGQTSRIQQVPHLIEEQELKQIPNNVSPLLLSKEKPSYFSGQGMLPQESFIYKGSYVLTKNVYSSSHELSSPIQWLLAGPRKYLYFKPSNVKAAIVTCGGLCPGLNVVIRELFINLNIHYGCPQVWGVPFGYQGLYSKEWKLMNLTTIKNLQFLGGTFLGSSRGGFDAPAMLKALTQRGINQLYVIGGDGTQRGVHILHQQIRKNKLEIAVIGIPKTIDNDIPIIDKSFGFETSVSESIRAIRSAYVESVGVQYGIGLVRLMGRDAGFIAMEATNASRDVDVCLIPEAKFNIYGEHGLLEYIYKQLLKKSHLVIVVAEGAGTGVQDLEALKEGVVRDQSNNIKLPDIGAFLKKEIEKYCAAKKLKITLKYIDPTYMIRTVPANSHDVRMCSQLAAAAVHGGMAGFTGFMSGHVNGALAMIPVSQLFGKQGKVDINGRTWQRLLAGTGQPEFREQ